MINETIYAKMVLAVCTDLFDALNVMRTEALFIGYFAGLLVGILLGMWVFHMIRKIVMNENVTK